VLTPVLSFLSSDPLSTDAEMKENAWLSAANVQCVDSRPYIY